MAPRKGTYSEDSQARKEIAQAILEEYQPHTMEDAEEAVKAVFGSIFEAMLQGEMEAHLGYQANEHGEKETTDRRNGYINKTVKTNEGEVAIRVPRDRDATFEPQIVPKRKRDVSDIEGNVLKLFGCGMSQRDIADVLGEIYGFKISPETVSNITDQVRNVAKGWQNRELKPFYTFLFVDCLYVNIRKDGATRNCAVYVILGYDVDGVKDILGIWVSDAESEGKHYWMQVFDEIRARGVEDVMFMSIDGVSGLEDGAKSIFPNVIVQRCIVHMIRNSIRYIPSKDYSKFTSQLKKVYGAVSLSAAEEEFERFKEDWKKYPGAVRVWNNNWEHVRQLFDFGSAVRKIMYTTNAIESVNSSFRKVTKKGAFASEDSVLKALYSRVEELYKKWGDRPMQNWSYVRNQIVMDDRLEKRFLKYEKK